MPIFDGNFRVQAPPRVSAAMAVALVTDQVFVRYSFVGTILNGRRHRAGARPLERKR